MTPWGLLQTMSVIRSDYMWSSALTERVATGRPSGERGLWPGLQYGPSLVFTRVRCTYSCLRKGRLIGQLARPLPSNRFNSQTSPKPSWERLWRAFIKNLYDFHLLNLCCRARSTCSKTSMSAYLNAPILWLSVLTPNVTRQHPNIVKYKGFVKTREYLYIILEYCENGSLHNICKRFGKFPESLVAVYISQVSRISWPSHILSAYPF